MKNTNLKIIHRIVAEDDRNLIAGAMCMDSVQRDALASFGVGKVAVFEDGEDAPLMLSVPPAKDSLGNPPLDDTVRRHMCVLAGEVRTCTHRACQDITASSSACQRGATAASDPMVRRTVAKMVLSGLSDPEAFTRLRHDLETVAETRLRLDPTDGEAWRCMLVHSAHALAERWGARLRWPFGETSEWAQALAETLVSSQVGDGRAREPRACTLGKRLIEKSGRPCPACAEAHERFDDTDSCFAQPAVLDLIDEEAFAAAFTQAEREDDRTREGPRSLTLSVANSAAFELTEFPAPGMADPQHSIRRARRCMLCFTYQSLLRKYVRAPWVIAAQLGRVAASFETAATGHSQESEDGR